MADDVVHPPWYLRTGIGTLTVTLPDDHNMTAGQIAEYMGAAVADFVRQSVMPAMKEKDRKPHQFAISIYIVTEE